MSSQPSSPEAGTKQYEKTQFGNGKAAQAVYGLAIVLLAPVVIFVSVRVSAILGMVIVLAGLFGSWRVADLFAGRHKRSNQQKRDARAAKILEEARQGRAGQYSLYLRSFQTTGQMTVENFDVKFDRESLYSEAEHFVDFETLLAEFGERVAPLLGLGKPGEHIGAGRVESTDERWQDDIKTLAEHAMFLFILPSRRKGTFWEVEFVRQNRYLYKSILIMPPEDKRQRLPWREIWEEMVPSFRERSLELPQYTPRGMVFTMGKDGRMAASISLDGVNSAQFMGAFIYPLLRGFVQVRHNHVFKGEPLY